MKEFAFIDIVSNVISTQIEIRKYVAFAGKKVIFFSSFIFNC